MSAIMHANHRAAEPHILPDLSALLPTLPPAVTRRHGAELLRRHLGFPVSPRSLERWPVPVRLVNGKATLPTYPLFAEAVKRINAAPVLMGGSAKAAA
ncbi:hypothetical protein ACE7GA_21370 [Roseomonas sp. CCTCC AB2023176]|uniref:hypothetical protein n=1 Tax=Roseomonas sp. CCTCC AB2023176 TaxID=3342640 RepID=UPI0035DDAF2C